MTVQEYLKNPCGLLSIPYWKAQKITIPEYMKILHDNEFFVDILQEYTDTEYFRLKHNLTYINKTVLEPEFNITSIKETQFTQLVELINNSYAHLGIKVDLDQIIDWTNTEVYAPDLWTAIFTNDIMVGAIIIDYDKVTKEAIIEWMQVLPEFRRSGLASLLINNSLKCLRGKADFVTVSGMINNKTNPETLYRKCGFTGDDLWHILIKKNNYMNSDTF